MSDQNQNGNGEFHAAPVGKKISLPRDAFDPESMGMAKVQREAVVTLQQFAIEAETIGIAKITTGQILASYAGINEVQAKVRQVLDECEDAESVSMLANAYASLEKSKASVMKNSGISAGAGDKPRSGRKSFARGPVVDVKVQ